MSTTAAQGDDQRRDEQGRHWTAPAWTGDLAQLDAAEVSRRADFIGDHIGRTTATFSVLAEPGEQFVVSVDVAEVTRWAHARAACLNELERRAEEAGVSRVDLIFAAPTFELV